MQWSVSVIQFSESNNWSNICSCEVLPNDGFRMGDHRADVQRWSSTDQNSERRSM
uniref:Uncharacterized protein n=1 Tax=Angiostrongylus cantonensis TaxID=6313 RepID=A0A0K0DCK3_ANGCA